MSKIYPNIPSLNSHSSSERQEYTVWMKSLVFNGNGCTVFDSKGDVVYRVDNYQKTGSSEVFLMDSSGKVLFSIKTKKFQFFRCREGFKWSGDDDKVNRERPWFRVRRNCTVLRKNMACRVTLMCSENNGDVGYEIVESKGKSEFKITDFSGRILAEAVPKKSSKGVMLGEDVMTLMVEPNADQSLIMSLVTVYGLMKKKL